MTYIAYTGIGADESGIHTKKRFMQLMKEHKRLFKFDEAWTNPKTLDEWVEYAGAVKVKKLPRGLWMCPECDKLHRDQD